MSDQIEATSSDPSEWVARAVAAARAAEEASQKANSEAGFAFNAKGAAEEHARAISEIKGRAESDASWFATTRQGVEQAQATVTAIRAELESTKRTSGEALVEMEKLRGSTKTAAGEIADRATETAALREQVLVSSKTVTQLAATAADQRSASEAAAKRATELLAQVSDAATKVTDHAAQVVEKATAVDAASKAAKELVSSMASAAKMAADTLKIIEAMKVSLLGSRAIAMLCTLGSSPCCRTRRAPDWRHRSAIKRHASNGLNSCGW